MNFMIFMELVGTAVLPAAISFTIYLIVISFFMVPPPIIPLGLLAAILVSPALLIMLTAPPRRWGYIFWMCVYLLSLPLWNFILPAYAYWHFDDFSWGETRKIAGTDDKAHGFKDGEFDSKSIVMRQWEEYERDRRRLVALNRLNGQIGIATTALKSDLVKDVFPQEQ
jgi:chitin synthase